MLMVGAILVCTALLLVLSKPSEDKTEERAPILSHDENDAQQRHARTYRSEKTKEIKKLIRELNSIVIHQPYHEGMDFPEGMKEASRLRAELQEAVMQWYDRDPGQCLKYVLRFQTGSTEMNFLVHDLFAEAARRNFEETMRIARPYLDDHRHLSGGLKQLFVHSPQDDAESFVAVYRLAISDERSDLIHAGPITYREGFPFEETLESLAKMYGERTEGQHWLIYPKGMLGEWNKRDSRAAYEWLKKGRTIFGNSGFSMFSTSYPESASAEVFGAMTADWHKQHYVGGDRYRDASFAFKVRPEPAMIDGFIAAMGDGEARDVHLTEILKLMDHQSDNHAKARAVLLAEMSPEARVRFYTDKSKTSYPLDDTAKSILSDLGHPDEEIASIIRTQQSDRRDK